MHVTHLDDHASSLRSRPRHSGPRSGETSALRLARLTANLGNGIIQQTPGRMGSRRQVRGTGSFKRPPCWTRQTLPESRKGLRRSERFS